jgi:tetratricopeptide (TPR) repeat protein
VDWSFVMLCGNERWRWAVAGILAATAMGWRVEGAVFAQDVEVERVRGEETSPDEAKKVDPKKDVEAKEEKKDPTDIRNTIGNLSLIRGLEELKKPKPKGLWEQLVDQPYFTPAVRAQKLLFHGQYAEAEKKYEDLLKGDAGNQEFLEGYLDAIVQQGRMEGMKKFDGKVAGLSPAQRDTAKMVRLRAESLLFRGRVSEAREILKRFTERHPKLDASDGEALATYNLYAKALEDSAEYAAAMGIYAQVEAVAVGGFPDDPQAATQITLAVYRKSVLSGTGKTKYNSVLSELAAIEEKDQTYWPAKLVQAQVLMNSHNNADGGKLLGEVISLNPNEIEARFLAIENAISGYNFEMARAQLEEVKSRTDSALADAFEGRLLLKERLPQQAVAPLLEAIKKNPQLAQARGWLAGAYFLLVEPAKIKEQLDAIHTPPGEGADGIHPVVLYEAGEILRDARQFEQAEKFYLQARQAAKWWSEPCAALAQLYLETGQEKEAKEAYDASFAIDPYNRRAFNQLKLLEYLQKFSTKESKTRLREGSKLPAFIIRYDPQDEVLASLAMEWMEKVRPEIWSYFQIHDLPAPTQIEFFPSHEEFGVRTTGLPWIGTVGASTGNVIALDVPRGGAKDMMGAFDWARVLRHEYTHTVTLAMTNNRIPHWLTEAAACEQEQAPRDWDNCQLLAANFRAGELFTIANLNWGFIRPKRSIDRQLAYMESQWLYQYLVATYGLPKMLEFLHAFRDGATEAAAWPKVYGKTMEEMDKEFLAWAKTQIESWGLPTDKLPKRAELEAVVKKDPKDVESLVKLAYVMAGSGNGKKAKELLEKALAIEPKHLRARELLGAVLAQGKEPDKEKGKALLEGVVKDDAKRPVAVRTLGVLAMERRDFDEAEKWFTQLQELRPLDDASYTNLAGIYLVKKDYPKAIAQLLELQRHEQHDERIPRKLAQLFQQQGQLREAEESAYRSIRINPYNAINHQLMAQILMEEKQPERSLEFWKSATELQPKVGEFWEGLAEARGETGDKEGASAAAKKAVALDPRSAAAKWVIKE